MRRPVAVLLCLLAVPAFAGCGGDDVKDLAKVDVAKAAERTAAQKTARMTMTMRMSGMGLPSALQLDASGVMDLERPRGTMTLDLAPMLKSFGAPASDAKLELRIDGGDFYAQLPDVEPLRALTDGKRWVKADILGIAKQLGFDVDGLSGAMNPSPSAQLQMLRSVKGFEEVGPRHFKGTFTMRDVIAALPADARAAAEQAMKKLEAVAGESVLDQKQTAELWLDENGLARQWRSEVPFGKEGKMTISSKLSDFGTKLDIQAPPADETFEITGNMVSQLLAGALTS